MGSGLRECPGCHREKQATSFVAELCRGCYAAGVEFPDSQQAASSPRGPETNRVHRAGRQEAGRMKEKTAENGYQQCPHCGDMKSNLSEHRKVCPKRPVGGGAETVNRGTGEPGKRGKGKVRRRKATKRALPARRQEVAPLALAERVSMVAPRAGIVGQLERLRDACARLLEALEC